MSEDKLQYSIDNQKAAIREFAESHGFEVARTYADAGKSGVATKRRTALRDLLDVIGGIAEYKRFPDGDEAAHYELSAPGHLEATQNSEGCLRVFPGKCVSSFASSANTLRRFRSLSLNL